MSSKARWFLLVLLSVVLASNAETTIVIHNQTGTEITTGELLACAVGPPPHCGDVLGRVGLITSGKSMSKEVKYTATTCAPGCAQGISIDIGLKDRDSSWCNIFPQQLTSSKVDVYVKLGVNGFPFCVVQASH